MFRYHKMPIVGVCSKIEQDLVWWRVLDLEKISTQCVYVRAHAQVSGNMV